MSKQTQVKDATLFEIEKPIKLGKTTNYVKPIIKCI